MIILSIVIIINFVLTLQVSTASLSHDREPREIKVVFNHTCSLHTCVCAWAACVGGAYAQWLLTEGIASLLGVSQVTIFRSVSVPNTRKYSFLMTSPQLLDISPFFLLIFSPLKTADFLMLLKLPGDGYSLLCSKKQPPWHTLEQIETFRFDF